MAGTTPCTIHEIQILPGSNKTFASELSSGSSWEEQEHLKGEEQLVSQNALVHNMYCFLELVTRVATPAG